eukprot:scaffold80506_cov15-Phaeocystis_antarctica.AAC.1
MVGGGAKGGGNCSGQGGRRLTLLLRQLLPQRGQFVAQLLACDDAAAVRVEDLPWWRGRW